MNLFRKINTEYILNYAKYNYTSGTFFGITIGLINGLNIKKSPKSFHETNMIDIIEFSSLITLKSMIYGICFPFSLGGILFDLGTDNFKNHFIPFSVYNTNNKKRKITDL